VINSVIRTRSTARIFLVCIYLLIYFINRKFPAVKQSVFLLDQKFSVMWQGSNVLWNEIRGFRPRERKFHGTCPRGRKFHRVELSSPGTKVPDTPWHYWFDTDLLFSGWDISNASCIILSYETTQLNDPGCHYLA